MYKGSRFTQRMVYLSWFLVWVYFLCLGAQLVTAVCLPGSGTPGSPATALPEAEREGLFQKLSVTYYPRFQWVSVELEEFGGLPVEVCFRSSDPCRLSHKDMRRIDFLNRTYWYDDQEGRWRGWGPQSVFDFGYWNMQKNLRRMFSAHR
jgi:hypothetical protein